MRASKQSAYHILVSKSSSVLSGDVWDSGKVPSSQSTLIAFGGLALESDTSYFWKVKWWDSTGNESPFSEVAQFDTGLYKTSDWQGQWIGGFNQLRTEFSLDEEPVRARLFILGLGYYRAYINGRRIGDHVLGPFTTFQKRVLYDTHDVTDYLSFSNALAVELGAGWYAQGSVNVGPRTLLLQLNIQLKSGKNFTVVSDTKWQGIQGPVTEDDIYVGETYDARLETPGWDRPHFNSTGWSSAVVVHAPSSSVTISSQVIQPIKEIDSYTPVSISQPSAGVYVFDFGQNMAGYCELTVSGPRGTKVLFQHAEMLYPDGNIHHLYPNSPEIDTYILKGEGIEVYKPRFTYHGFQYVALTGYPGVPDLDTLKAYFIHTALPETGEIVFSNKLLNQIQHITRFASLSNFMNIPTDCPQRERRGWLGDAQLSAETTIHNFDMSAAYTNFIRNIQDEQQYDNKNGNVGDCVPFYGHGGIPADPAWGTAYTLLWYWMYQYYGDTQILSQYYDGVKAHLEALVSNTNKTTGLLTFSRYGDWCGLATGDGCAYPSAVVSSFYYLTQLEMVASVASMLGKTTDAARYSSLASNVRSVWNREFYNPISHIYEHGYQTEQALALYLNIVAPSEKNNVIKELLNDITVKWTNHLNTGIVGTKYLLPVLSSIGRTDLAYTIATQDTYPSWGYMINNGATTLWENWEGDRYTTYGSRNHIMFGSQSDWYFKVLGGINLTPGTVGFTSIDYKPDVNSIVNQLTSVSSSIRTHRGLVESSWNAYSANALCGDGGEGTTVSLYCSDGLISGITFASYGLPTGTCGAFKTNPSCDAKRSVQVAQQACLGKKSCSIQVSNANFGEDPCPNIVKHFYIQVSGCAYPAFVYRVTVPVNSDAKVSVPKIGHANVTITEGQSTVWQNGKFVPGTSGISSGVDSGEDITFTAGSGSYVFSVNVPK
eukprot:TRINITY_DN1797_c0_g1_i1.p1 TRINITY_DN1797_c0_g1~~TRINITY_DN1797_c0_g1_i1.p1  ORF type:complete len:940 (-),score=210.90 TRINITY_DN1797_c0_g1_i1:27-2846(-)